MDGAILVIAADEPCPQPQTREHLAAAEVSGIKNLIIVQNKIDIVDEKRALESYKEIKNFIKGTVAEKAPIIPISAQRGINIDVLLNAIETIIPTPKRDETKPPLMYVIRSFDVNKPGTTIEGFEGGIIGGTIAQGKFVVGEEIEIRPGISVEREGKTFYDPLISEIVSLNAGEQSVKEATCGGLSRRRNLARPILLESRRLNRKHSWKSWNASANTNRTYLGNPRFRTGSGNKRAT